jgi:hypothetical protein
VAETVALILVVAAIAAAAIYAHRRSSPAAGDDVPTASEATDARRLARMLVSEIQLDNTTAVEEGRVHRDLYVRLRDEIDRSREVYEDQVRPVVRAERDHFADALVDLLADGDAGALEGYDGGGGTVVH